MGWEVSRDNWPGALSLVARIKVHKQQLCGLAWSVNGKSFASGGNDNICCLFTTEAILGKRTLPNLWTRVSNSTTHLHQHRPSRSYHPGQSATDSFESTTAPISPYYVRHLSGGCERYKWKHGAAVKAIAFHPRQDSPVATGGGSNDKHIHFFDTHSGLPLATIAVSAQVTSLIWSQNGREIVATFGYAHPEHPFRIAVFSWPDCKQVAAIPWEGSLRALYAISSPWNPSTYKAKSSTSRAKEGCIIVASSDQTIKFHDVWSIGCVSGISNDAAEIELDDDFNSLSTLATEQCIIR